MPPAEKLTLSSGSATADSRPPDSRNWVSTGVQPAFVRTRTGRADELDTSSPSGSAVTCDDAVVSELTTIALPVALAFVVAAASAASCAEAAPKRANCPEGLGPVGCCHPLPTLTGADAVGDDDAWAAPVAPNEARNPKHAAATTSARLTERLASIPRSRPAIHQENAKLRRVRQGYDGASRHKQIFPN